MKTKHKKEEESIRREMEYLMFKFKLDGIVLHTIKRRKKYDDIGFFALKTSDIDIMEIGKRMIGEVTISQERQPIKIIITNAEGKSKKLCVKQSAK